MRISVDAHVMEPDDLWTRRLPEAQRPFAPEYRRLPESTKMFVSNGRPIGISPEYRRYERGSDTRYEDIGPDDIDGYHRDLDADGVWAATLHPNAGMYVYDIDDPETAMACARIYNDHVAEVYESERLHPNALVPINDPDAAAAEIDRAAALGLHGIELPLSAPPERPYHLACYEPMWAAASRHGLPIAMHIGTGAHPGKRSGRGTGRPPGRARDIGPELDDTDRRNALLARKTARGGFGGLGGECLETIPDLVAGGVTAAHPDLHFLFVEVGARWLVGLMDHMDDAWYVGPGVRQVERTLFAADGTPVPESTEGELELEWPHELSPSGFVKRQIHVSFMDDWAALRNRAITGIDVLLWGNDYPHYEGSWPKSTDAITSQCERAGLAPQEIDWIFGGHAQQLYGVTGG
jgi:predicted TIM-barrel fold metal-dependent hydrolase